VRNLIAIRNMRIVEVHGRSHDRRGDRRVLEADESANVRGERAELVAFLAAHPVKGESIAATGGIRKIRWAREGTGKRGGARVIYCYHNERLPVFLRSADAKNRKANLTVAERNAMKRLVPAMVAGYPGRA
jgi:hypothetical protein